MIWILYFVQMEVSMKFIYMFVITHFQKDQSSRDNVQEELMEADLHAIVLFLIYPKFWDHD
jgi:hypothetical protein